MSESVTTSFYCKYHLPCGWCDLKKEQCTYFSTYYTLPKEYFVPSWNEPVTVYGCPTLDGGPKWEVNCAAERSEG